MTKKSGRKLEKMKMNNANIPHYTGISFFRNRKKIGKDIIYKCYDEENEKYCIIIDNHYDTVIRLMFDLITERDDAFKQKEKNTIDYIKWIVKKYPHVKCWYPSDEEIFESGDLVWFLFENGTTKETTNAYIRGEKIYIDGEEYNIGDTKIIQKKCPFDLIDDAEFKRFCGRK